MKHFCSMVTMTSNLLLLGGIKDWKHTNLFYILQLKIHKNCMEEEELMMDMQHMEPS